MNYSKFRNYILLFMLPILTACVDQTHSLIVFEDSIGVPKNALGVYGKTIDGETAYLSLCYKNSKYHLLYVGDTKSEAWYMEGKFVPSKVDGTDDYYILSFPKLTGYKYKKNEKRKYKDDFTNAIIYSKFEENNFISWINNLSDEDEKKSIKEIKRLIRKSYSKTFINDSIKLSKSGTCSSLSSLKSIKNKVKKRYSKYQEK